MNRDFQEGNYMQKEMIVYEDAGYKNLYPLSLTRPVFHLRCGIFTLLEKLVRHFPGYRIAYGVRKVLAGLVKESHPEAMVNVKPESAAFFINGRFILEGDIPTDLEKSTAFRLGKEIVGAYLLAKDHDLISIKRDGSFNTSALNKLPSIAVEGALITYPWDLVHKNADQINDDFAFIKGNGQILGKLYPDVTLLAQENIYLAPAAELHPGVVVNSESGPVYIAAEARIMSNAVIEGPAYIGRGTTIKVGAKIYEGTSIGPGCKVGGEVECSILQAHSNKQHEGFLGHAFLGEWVNIGAGTNNSDLKNNYGTVKMHVNGKLIDSGSQFVGLFMGDHAKCGINTMFNTGTTVGIMSNVFGTGYLPKFIPSFAWGGDENGGKHDLKKALATARVVMARRKKKLTKAQAAVLRQVSKMVMTNPV